MIRPHLTFDLTEYARVGFKKAEEYTKISQTHLRAVRSKNDLDEENISTSEGFISTSTI